MHTARRPVPERTAITPTQMDEKIDFPNFKRNNDFYYSRPLQVNNRMFSNMEECVAVLEFPPSK